MMIRRTVGLGAEMSQPAATMQSGALAYRRDGQGGVEVLLITTLGAGRWSIPKGGVAAGYGFAASAAKEAEEEAGVTGRVGPTAIGVYRALQRVASGGHRVVEVWVYPLRVDRCLAEWRERGRRQVRWFAAAKAVALVDEPVIAALCRRLADGDIPV